MSGRIGHPETVSAPPASRALVCVVDSDPQSVQSLLRVLGDSDLVVRGFSSVIEVLENGHVCGPCCVVIEPELRGMDGFDLQRTLADSAVGFVFLSGQGDVAMCARAMKAGAVDFLTKPAAPEILLEAVARALARSKTILCAQAARAAAFGKIASLTGREMAVMHRVIAGMLNKQIAAELGIAEKTIKVHRGRVMRKTGAISVPDLVRLAIAAGISCLDRSSVAS